MANRITFDPTEDPTPEMMAAEQAALDQGEKLVNAQQQDRNRKYKQAEAEQEDVSLIAGKFKSQDDLLKAYNELQKKLSTPSEGDSEEGEEEEAPEATEEVPEETEIDENVRKFVDISQRFESEGGLTEEDVETLSNMDSKTLIETYFKYHAVQSNKVQAQAATQAEMSSIRQSVGGDEAYGEMIEWASQNLNESEIDQFNAVVSTNNANAIKYAVESLSNRWRGSEGYEAPLVTGRKAPSKGKVFRSQAELARAIADPRYSSDPAYRMDVEEKLARSGNLL
jgi:hypothetical protein